MGYFHGESSKTPWKPTDVLIIRLIARHVCCYWLELSKWRKNQRLILIPYTYISCRKVTRKTYQMTCYLACHIFFSTEIDQHGNVWQGVVRRCWRFGCVGILRLLFNRNSVGVITDRVYQHRNNYCKTKILILKFKLYKKICIWFKLFFILSKFLQ